MLEFGEEEVADRSTGESCVEASAELRVTRGSAVLSYRERNPEQSIRIQLMRPSRSV